MSKPIAIYIRRNRVNGKEYVGQSVDPKKRWYNELYEDYVIGHALRKYGADSFENTILFWVDSQEAANFWECYLIELYGTLRPNGYNVQDGGSHGNPFAGKSVAEMELIRNKQSESAKIAQNRPEVKQRKVESQLGNRNRRGNKVSDETKRSISESLKGNSNALGYKHTSEFRRKVSENHADVSGENNPMHRENMRRREGITQLELFEEED